MDGQLRDNQKGFFLFLALLLCVLSQAFFAFKFNSPINSVLFLDLDFSDKHATLIDQALACLAILFCFLGLKNPRFFIFSGLWLFTIALSKTILHSSFAYEIMVPAHASRFLLAFALAFSSKKVLRYGIGITFIAHGLEAWWENPIFMEYIYDFTSTFFQYDPSEKAVLFSLKVIAVVDIIVGAWALFSENKKLFFWLFFWGIITAFERVLYHNWVGWFEFFIRAPHYIVPLTIALWDLAPLKLKEDLKWQNA